MLTSFVSNLSPETRKPDRHDLFAQHDTMHSGAST